MNEPFSDLERDAVYRVIRERRDVRSTFLPDPIPDSLLLKLLEAAHCAPSVGLMQPWEFIVIRSREVRATVRNLFLKANQAAAERYEGEKRAIYDSLKLEGILDTPLNLCVTCNPEANRGSGLGRRTMPETALYSTVCAVQNLWLAARAEGIGVGWVSILSPSELRTVLHIPETIIPVAYLCVGFVSEFLPSPELEQRGWEHRVPVETLIHDDFYLDTPRKES